MNSLETLRKEIRQFTEDRDWNQFHNPKDLALALSIEASELVEVFLWKDADKADKEKVKEELADVLNYALLLADQYDFDVVDIVRQKMERNALKYPVDKAKGIAKKYTEL